MRAEIVLVYFLMLFWAIPLSSQSTEVETSTPQGESFTMVAFGTGQTTGHIATLTVTNNTAAEVNVAPQSFLLPALQTYQSYVGRIPAGISIKKGESVEIALTGFCIDVHSPPIPLGRALLPVKDWVPVGTKIPNPGIVTTTLLPRAPLVDFSLSDIGFLKTLPEFKTQRSKKGGVPRITYPGSETPIGGSLSKITDMAKIAPLLVAMVQSIEAATPMIQEEYTTPFQGDLLKEREAIIQQSVWIFMAQLTGASYTQEDFAKKVEQELQQRTGTLANSLPPGQQAKLETGINNFWTAFLATGAAAKVWR
ncbi:hypothetical protein [Lewinella cohaerens]|uniref:hypothetical protein n=1 Tax=Lewinella cohaerens TaxID=70995 RepID=UPI0003669FEF|nr:hypothetical protein [Lewinella cohaerens]